LFWLIRCTPTRLQFHWHLESALRIVSHVTPFHAFFSGSYHCPIRPYAAGGVGEYDRRDAMKPTLFTFDVFGTIVDWRSGLRADLAKAGHSCSDAIFDDIIAAQAALEAGPFRTYREITATSLLQVVGLDGKIADQIGQNVGRWPLYPDAGEGLQSLMRTAACVAMTNSDRVHGQQVQEQLGFPLSDWICAEDVGVYKPDPAFWHAVATKRGIKPNKSWWHVSAYADYDLATATKLGLTTVIVERRHAVAGHADFCVADLCGLAGIVEMMGELERRTK
jgi:2-haloacid dehalogenase